MRKTFVKYYITAVFILISGVFHSQANSIAGHGQDTALSQYCNALPNTSTALKILPFSPDFDFNFGQILLEETELNEYDHTAEKPDFTSDLDYLRLSGLIFNFYLNYWNTQQSSNSLSSYAKPLQNAHCKRYIQLEVFRI